MGAAGQVLNTLFEQATNTSTAENIVGPASIKSGDILVLLDRAINSSGIPTSVVPSGFSSISDLSDTPTRRQILSRKLADGTEASSNLTGMNGTSTNNKVIYVFRGNVPVETINVASVNGESTDVNPTTQFVVPGSIVPLLIIGAYGSTGAIDPRTFSPAKDSELNQNTLLYLAYRIYNISPATTTIDMDDEGDGNILQSCYIDAA